MRKHRKTQESLISGLKNHYKKENLALLWLPQNPLEAHMASFSRGPLWLNQLANLRPRNNTDSQRLAAPEKEELSTRERVLTMTWTQASRGARGSPSPSPTTLCEVSISEKMESLPTCCSALGMG